VLISSLISLRLSPKATFTYINQAFSYQIFATNNATSFAASGLPPGLSVNAATGVISGTPTALGTYIATISATNADGTGTAIFTLKVLGPVPIITSSLNQGFDASDPFNYQITATNHATAFAANGLPSGLSVDTATGEYRSRL